MHLGLIDGPFVPHNLISAQDSPVPLPKFHMAPIFKILIFSESKKGTQIYHPFLSKSPCKRIPSSFSIGAPMERDARFQGIFTFLLKYIFLSFPQSPRYWSPLHVPKQDPHWQGYPVTRATGLFIYLYIQTLIHVCLPESPKTSLPTYGEKHKVTVHGAPHKQKAYIQWNAACFPKGTVLSNCTHSSF